MACGEKMPVLKIAFDQQVFLLQQYGGISRYICSLAKHLNQIPDTEAKIFAPLHFNHTLAELEGAPCDGRKLPPVNTKFFRPISLASTLFARSAIRRFRPDILHETYFSHGNYRPRGSKIVLTVYDMTFERYPEMFRGGHRTAGPKKSAVLRADHVICISESTRNDLIEFTGVAKDKTSVVYLAAEPKVFVSEDEGHTSADSLPPFLIYVGSRNGYKNFTTFLKAFSRSDFLKQNLSILCFGGGPFSQNELAIAAEQGLREDQLLYRSGDDQSLATYYRRAHALVYPSMYEGFGIPLLEAMASDCPVICSRSSSLPEVGGDAVEYCDPHSEMDMMLAMERVLQTDSLRLGLVEKGRLQCAKFSWQRCAKETLEIYRRVM
jgi:glycosyltransferase involved in cell wall biosynthesis